MLEGTSCHHCDVLHHVAVGVLFCPASGQHHLDTTELTLYVFFLCQVDTSTIKPAEWERLRTGIALKTFTALMKKYVVAVDWMTELFVVHTMASIATACRPVLGTHGLVSTYPLCSCFWPASAVLHTTSHNS